MPDPDPAAALRLLVSLLRRKQSAGQRQIPITRDARENLARLAPDRPGSGAAARPSRSSAAPAPSQSQAPRAPSPSPASPDAERRLAALRRRAESDERCLAMDTLRDAFVFATGNHNADLMFVGEAPGYDEERLGEPFVGKAGKLLDKIIMAMGLERSGVYISNIVKWRPKIGDGQRQGTANRKPGPEEMDACRGFIMEEVKIVRPKVVVALGGTAAAGLLGLTDPVVARMRSRFHDLDGTPAMVTYHPSYLLHNDSLSEKRKVWEDMLMVMEKLNLPVSQKQLGYFKAKR